MLQNFSLKIYFCILSLTGNRNEKKDKRDIFQKLFADSYASSIYLCHYFIFLCF